MNYTLLQWLLMFYTYAFLGWIWECSYVSVKNKELVNRGFLYGPMIPIYGFGAIIILWLTLPFKENIVLIYILGALGASILEYVTGALMEKIFKVRYWDYSHHKYNINGHVSLFISLGWGIFSIVLIKVLHQPIENVILKIPYHIAEILSLIVTIAFVADVTISTQLALDLKMLLQQSMENNKLIASLSIKLNDIKLSLNDTSDEFNKHITILETDIKKHIENFNFKEKTHKKASKGFPLKRLQRQNTSKFHLLERLNNRLDLVIKEIQEQEKIKSDSPSTEKIKISEKIKELNDIKSNIRKLELNISALNDKVYKRVKGLIRRNPISVSRDFENTLQEIKSFIKSKNNKKQK